MTIDTPASVIAARFADKNEAAELELAILRHMEHHVAKAVKVEREECAYVAEMHENWVRDYSREVFARAIADKIRQGTGPTEQELRFKTKVSP